MGLATIEVHDLRKFTHDKHRSVDYRPFGGGAGMVLKPEPLFESLESLQLASREDRVAGRAKQAVFPAFRARRAVHAEDRWRTLPTGTRGSDSRPL